MTDIDTTHPVLVTGATGYVAGWIVKQLLDAGVTVHAAVRDPDNTAKIAHLQRLAEQAPGTVRFFRADLRDADFTGARMRSTDFLNADLSGALWVDGKRRCAAGSIGQCQ